jgi:hypothetical protein
MVQVGLAMQLMTGSGQIAGAGSAKQGIPRSEFESRVRIEKESMLNAIILHRGVSGTVPPAEQYSSEREEVRCQVAHPET